MISNLGAGFRQGFAVSRVVSLVGRRPLCVFLFSPSNLFHGTDHTKHKKSSIAFVSRFPLLLLLSATRSVLLQYKSDIAKTTLPYNTIL